MKPPLRISPLFFVTRRILSIDYLLDDRFYRYVTDYQGNNLITYGINGGRDPWVYVRDSADFIMGAVGYAGPVGCAISASYFIVTAAVDAKIAQNNEDK